MAKTDTTKQSPQRLTIESLRQARSTPDWLFAAARAYRQWAIGQEVTEADYDATVTEVGGLRCGYDINPKEG